MFLVALNSDPPPKKAYYKLPPKTFEANHQLITFETHSKVLIDIQRHLLPFTDPEALFQLWPRVLFSAYSAQLTIHQLVVF